MAERKPPNGIRCQTGKAIVYNYAEFVPKTCFDNIANNYSNFCYTGGIIPLFSSRYLSGVLKRPSQN